VPSRQGARSKQGADLVAVVDCRAVEPSGEMQSPAAGTRKRISKKEAARNHAAQQIGAVVKRLSIERAARNAVRERSDARHRAVWKEKTEFGGLTEGDIAGVIGAARGQAVLPAGGAGKPEQLGSRSVRRLTARGGIQQAVACFARLATK